MNTTAGREQSTHGTASSLVTGAAATAHSLTALDQCLEAALAHHRAGRTAEAAWLYRQILETEPEHADAMHFSGLLACETGDVENGIERMKLSVRRYASAVYYNNLGTVMARHGDRRTAIAAYRDALALKPDYVEAHNNLGDALREEGDYIAAMESCARALELRPDYAQAWNNLGNALKDHGSYEAAMKSYVKALRFAPDYAEVHNNLGNLFEKQDQLDAAIASYRRAIALQPAVAAMHNNLGNVLRDQGDLDEALACFRHAIGLEINFVPAWSNLLLQLGFLPHTPLCEQIDEARRFGELQLARARPFSHESVRGDADLQRRLRVGFVSGDLKTHPVGFFLESVVAHLDPASIELVAYTTQRHEDALTARLKPYFAAWHPLADLSDEACANRIHADRIDILVDLSGHTPHNRLPVFAWKPAPIQVSWLGYFATTGVGAIDYILGDPFVLPQTEASHFVERPWRLPSTYLCFTPPQPDIANGPLPALTNSGLTFGSFNHLVKLNDAVVALWARVLHAVPGSRLHLKTKQLNDPSVQRTTCARFAAHGIDSARLTLEGQSPRAELLAAYQRVDIALDPFPYPGGTTTVEALWMGVPVLTRRGDRFLSHVGESILNNVGVPEWIADDDDDYIARAVAFAANLDGLSALRARLRQQLLASPVCDARRFAASLESAFRGMWRQFAVGAPTPSCSQARVQAVVNTDRPLAAAGADHSKRVTQ